MIHPLFEREIFEECERVIIWSPDTFEELTHLLIEEWEEHNRYFSEISYEYEKYGIHFFTLCWVFYIELPWSSIIDIFIDF